MKLRAYLTQHRIKLAEFAAAIGRSTATVSRIARGLNKPDWKTAIAISQATGGQVMPNDFAAAEETNAGSRGRYTVRERRRRYSARPPPSAITLDDLDATTLARLDARARQNRRSLKSEITEILNRVASPEVGEFAAWAARFRSRLRSRYTGDATADIRADRQR